MNTGDDERDRRRRLAYIDEIRELVDPADEAFFAGMGLDPEEASVVERWAFRIFGGDVVGDGRDWVKIRGWAEGLAI
jgi:hypothetical protein